MCVVKCGVWDALGARIVSRWSCGSGAAGRWSLTCGGCLSHLVCVCVRWSCCRWLRFPNTKTIHLLWIVPKHSDKPHLRCVGQSCSRIVAHNFWIHFWNREQLCDINTLEFRQLLWSSAAFSSPLSLTINTDHRLTNHCPPSSVFTYFSTFVVHNWDASLFSILGNHLYDYQHCDSFGKFETVWGKSPLVKWTTSEDI